MTQGEPRYLGFEGQVVRYEDAPSECTIYPRDVDESERATAWLSAREGSYCWAEAMR